MQVYLVGGAVRDELLGLPVNERDWVVVGATREELERLGYRAVGRDFPVLLHPETHEEYALARRERKTAPGYRGFSVEFGPEVTIEEDLSRRDLTVNAMARSADGTLIDPFGGARDIESRTLRHVSAAFVEDLTIDNVIVTDHAFGIFVNNRNANGMVDAETSKHLTVRNSQIFGNGRVSFGASTLPQGSSRRMPSE